MRHSKRLSIFYFPIWHERLGVFGRTETPSHHFFASVDMKVIQKFCRDILLTGANMDISCRPLRFGPWYSVFSKESEMQKGICRPGYDSDPEEKKKEALTFVMESIPLHYSWATDNFNCSLAACNPQSNDVSREAIYLQIMALFGMGPDWIEL